MPKSAASEEAFEISASTADATGREAFRYAGKWASRAMPPAPITIIGLGWETGFSTDRCAASTNDAGPRDERSSGVVLIRCNCSLLSISRPSVSSRPQIDKYHVCCRDYDAKGT